jgi:putative spermidine/putrescine transport system permease protein
MLTVGHTIITIPYVVRNVAAILRSHPGHTEEAARVLGANAWKAFWHVTVPLIKPGLLAGGFFASLLLDSGFLCFYIARGSQVIFKTLEK